MNSTGTPFRGIYISPSDSPGWEENILGADLLNDGGTVTIRFNPAENCILWDLKVQDTYGHYAEWKNIKLNEVSRITLSIDLRQNAMAVAEVE